MRALTLRGLIAIFVAALLLGGCASNEPEYASQDVEVEEPDAGQETDSAADLDELPPEPVAEVLPGVFYFDYDQAIVKRAGHEALDKHAERLAGDAGLGVRLEGHADERGTREYNLALGERRANAIRAYLVAQGALQSQVEVISYGEEKPIDPGHGEAAWAQNRRVEIVYR